MSDMPATDRVQGLGSRDAIRGVTSAWWLFLILGVLWILFGMFVLSYNVGSLLALAVFAGVTFLMTGVTQIVSATRAHSWRWLYLIGGILSILAGIVAFVWPGRTLLVLSVILAWFLVFKGIVDIVGSLASHGRPWWWLGLILGILELLLGIWAAGYPGRSLFVFVNLVGVYAIFYGFTELFAAFDLRGLGRDLERMPPTQPAQ
ncbi:MAG TPA: HdeD family acid-resistance protein [Actinomycetota bacterium]|nr:HdeD family acid-resistance protein [Actinomycetota bacterium]